MAEDLLLGLYPCLDPRFAKGGGTVGGCYGCKTASIEDFGHVYASTTSAPAFVEGIVSSLANWKLYSTGFTHDLWDAALMDLPTGPDYPSVLRPGELTPAGCVVHVSYCMAHILVYYRSLLNLTPRPHGVIHQIGQSYVRLQRGTKTLRNILPIASGGFEHFLENFLAWSDGLLTQPPERA